MKYIWGSPKACTPMSKPNPAELNALAMAALRSTPAQPTSRVPPPPPPPPSPTTLGLGALMGWDKPTFTRAWFNNQQVRLDGVKFDHCRFDGCTLLVSTADIEIYQSKFENCRVAVLDPASRIAALALHEFSPGMLPPSLQHLGPLRHPDGAITIAPK